MAAASAVHLEPIRAASHKWLIALAVMLGTTLEVLDSSIVNVSLPHMQGSFSASVDEIAWVVTSYLVAAGIMIPMTGWIAARFGRKRYFIGSVITFIIASALCGVARTLDQIVIFRVLQGAFVNAVQLAPAEALGPRHQGGVAFDAQRLRDTVFAAPVLPSVLGLAHQRRELWERPAGVMSPQQHAAEGSEHQQRRRRLGKPAQQPWHGACPWRL